jgi:hypothetical protein
VTVHNVFVPMLGGDHFLARLLSQVVYRFGDRNGVYRARISRDGSLWWAESRATWGRELGVSAKTAQRGIDALIDGGFLQRRLLPYRRSADPEPGWTTHLRPNVEELFNRAAAARDAQGKVHAVSDGHSEGDQDDADQ